MQKSDNGIASSGIDLLPLTIEYGANEEAEEVEKITRYWTWSQGHIGNFLLEDEDYDDDEEDE